MTEWLAGMKFLPAQNGSLILSSEPQVWHSCGNCSLTRTTYNLCLIDHLASWLPHSPHLSASPSAMHTLLGFTMIHTQCFTLVSQLGSLLSNDLDCSWCSCSVNILTGQDNFTKGLTMEIARMHDGPQFSWRKRTENTLLHRKQLNTSKQPRLSIVPQIPWNASYVLSHCVLFASLGKHHSSTYVPYITEDVDTNNRTYLPRLVMFACSIWLSMNMSLCTWGQV